MFYGRFDTILVAGWLISTRQLTFWICGLLFQSCCERPDFLPLLSISRFQLRKRSRAGRRGRPRITRLRRGSGWITAWQAADITDRGAQAARLLVSTSDSRA